MKRKVDTKNAPGALGPYSQAIEIDNLVYTSGQLGIDPVSGEMPQDVTAQAELSLKNVQAILEDCGLGMNDIIKTLVFLTDMGDFAAVNEVYSRYINGDVLPARSCGAVAALPKGGLVEIEVIAQKR